MSNCYEPSQRYQETQKGVRPLFRFTPEQLAHQVGRWFDYYNNHRCHEAIGNVTPNDRFFGKHKKILERRKKINAYTMRLRRRLKREMALLT